MHSPSNETEPLSHREKHSLLPSLRVPSHYLQRLHPLSFDFLLTVLADGPLSAQTIPPLLLIAERPPRLVRSAARRIGRVGGGSGTMMNGGRAARDGGRGSGGVLRAREGGTLKGGDAGGAFKGRRVPNEGRAEGARRGVERRTILRVDGEGRRGDLHRRSRGEGGPAV